MKITQSIIILTSVIFVTGSMITVTMGLKKKTNHISTNVIEAKHRYNEDRAYLYENKAYKAITEQSVNDKLSQQKELYKLKLESLNQYNNTKSTDRFLQGKKIENGIID